MPRRSWLHGWQRPRFNWLGEAYIRVPWLRIFRRRRYLGWRCSHPANLDLGNRTDLGYGTYIQSELGVVIGHDTQLGAHCRVYSVDTERGQAGSVHIGCGCLVGAGTTILPGSCIPHGAKIRAHSLVLANAAGWTEVCILHQWKVRLL